MKKYLPSVFSRGFSFRVSRFQINYDSARYHLAGFSNLIYIALNMNDGYRKNERNEMNEWLDGCLVVCIVK